MKSACKVILRITHVTIVVVESIEEELVVIHYGEDAPIPLRLLLCSSKLKGTGSIDNSPVREKAVVGPFAGNLHKDTDDLPIVDGR